MLTPTLTLTLTLTLALALALTLTLTLSRCGGPSSCVAACSPSTRQESSQPCMRRRVRARARARARVQVDRRNLNLNLNPSPNPSPSPSPYSNHRYAPYERGVSLLNISTFVTNITLVEETPT